jgi:hypothetical protein
MQIVNSLVHGADIYNLALASSTTPLSESETEASYIIFRSLSDEGLD